MVRKVTRPKTPPFDVFVFNLTKVAQMIEKPKALSVLKNGLATTPDVAKSLADIRTVLGVDHSVYHLAPTAAPEMDIPFVRTTYDPGWVMRYITRNYMAIDPVLELGLSGGKPFFWSDIQRESETVAAFFADAERHGVGNCGYTVPITDRVGHRAMLTLNRNGADAEFRAHISGLARDIGDIAGILHRRCLTEAGIEEPVPVLSRREIECLSWTAQGKDASSIADILKISEHTVRDYLKSARTKLGCSTIAQAVYEASRLRLLKPKSE
jgi:LuxR family transcriptional regulator, quorum-sensing system regulator CinR